MRLLTDEIKQRFERYPLYSQEGKGINSTVLLSYFLLGMGLYFLKRITGVKAAVRFNC